jgi:hypothetical protein
LPGKIYMKKGIQEKKQRIKQVNTMIKQIVEQTMIEVLISVLF